MSRLCLNLLNETLAVCRLPAGFPIPAWALSGDIFSVTRTLDELSIVCSEEKVPDGLTVEHDWRALQVSGQLDFGLTGILSGIAGVLAEAGVSIFAVSTYNTDIILVKSTSLEKALVALRTAGYKLTDDES